MQSTTVRPSNIQESSVKKQTVHNKKDRAGINNINGIKKEQHFNNDYILVETAADHKSTSLKQAF